MHELRAQYADDAHRLRPARQTTELFKIMSSEILGYITHFALTPTSVCYSSDCMPSDLPQRLWAPAAGRSLVTLLQPIATSDSLQLTQPTDRPRVGECFRGRECPTNFGGLRWVCVTRSLPVVECGYISPHADSQRANTSDENKSSNKRHSLWRYDRSRYDPMALQKLDDYYYFLLPLLLLNLT